MATRKTYPSNISEFEIEERSAGGVRWSCGRFDDLL